MLVPFVLIFSYYHFIQRLFLNNRKKEYALQGYIVSLSKFHVLNWLKMDFLPNQRNHQFLHRFETRIFHRCRYRWREAAGEKDDQRDHRKQKCDHQMCQEECQWIYQLGAIPKSDHVCPGPQSHLLSLSDTKWKQGCQALFMKLQSNVGRQPPHIAWNSKFYDPMLFWSAKKRSKWTYLI